LIQSREGTKIMMGGAAKNPRYSGRRKKKGTCRGGKKTLCPNSGGIQKVKKDSETRHWIRLGGDVRERRMVGRGSPPLKDKNFTKRISIEAHNLYVGEALCKGKSTIGKPPHQKVGKFQKVRPARNGTHG